MYNKFEGHRWQECINIVLFFNKSPQILKLITVQIYYFTVPIGVSGAGLAGFSSQSLIWLKSMCQLKLRSHLRIESPFPRPAGGCCHCFLSLVRHSWLSQAHPRKKFPIWLTQIHLVIHYIWEILFVIYHSNHRSDKPSCLRVLPVLKRRWLYRSFTPGCRNLGGHLRMLFITESNDLDK